MTSIGKHFKYQPDVTLLGFVDTVNIDIEICVQECDWWAQTGSVRFDLKKHTMTVLRLNP